MFIQIAPFDLLLCLFCSSFHTDTFYTMVSECGEELKNKENNNRQNTKRSNKPYGIDRHVCHQRVVYSTFV